MPPAPRVTIITPTYNRAGLLPETIESVLAEAYPNLEFLLIDDGSTDNTAEIVRKYRAPVQYLHHPNQGEAYTVNRGWELATGDYVCVVNSDDPILPGLIGRSVEEMSRHPEIVVTYPDWNLIDEHSHVFETFRTPDYSYELMVTNLQCLPGPGAFIRRKVARPHVGYLRNPAFPLISDIECWWRLGLIGPFLHIPEVLGQWREHPSATTVQRARSLANASALIKLAHEFFGREDLPAHVRGWKRRTYGRAYVAASGLVNDVDPWRSVSFVLAGLWYSPAQALPHIKGALAHFPLLRRVYRPLKTLLRRIVGG